GGVVGAVSCQDVYHRHQVPLLSLGFFFQAEDGIRDLTVTGVQTCALPIFLPFLLLRRWSVLRGFAIVWAAALALLLVLDAGAIKIGRASCRERVWSSGVAAAVKR